MTNQPQTTDDIEVARRVARIMGPESAAAKAVARYDAVRAHGWDTRIIRTKTLWLVIEPHEPVHGVAHMGSSWRRDENDDV